MEFKINYCIGALLLLFTCIMKAEDTSFKAKFGEEFGKDLKKYHAQLLHSNMDQFEKLITSLLRDTKPTTDDEKQFESYLATVRHKKSRIGDSVNIPVVKEIKNFGKSVFRELILYQARKSLSKKEEGDSVKKLLEGFAEYENNVLKAFNGKIYKRYHEIYKKIPAEELEKYDEYTEIDELMERLTNRSIEKLGSQENILEYASIFCKLGEFFKYPEYKELCA